MVKMFEKFLTTLFKCEVNSFNNCFIKNLVRLTNFDCMAIIDISSNALELS